MVNKLFKIKQELVGREDVAVEFNKDKNKLHITSDTIDIFITSDEDVFNIVGDENKETISTEINHFDKLLSYLRKKL